MDICCDVDLLRNKEEVRQERILSIFIDAVK